MNNASRTLYRHAAQLLTLAGPSGARVGPEMGKLGLLTNASILVEEGKVAWVGRDDELAGIDGDAQEIDCRGKTIMPAFVDSHTHLVWGGHRRDELEMRLGGADYEAIFAAGGGILSSVRQTRSATEEALYLDACARIDRMRRTGTLTFEIKSGYGLDLDTELRQLRVVRRLAQDGHRVRATCLAAHALPEEARASAATREAFIDSIIEHVLPAVVAEHLADYCDVFCDRGAFTYEESRRVLSHAKALGMIIRVHANEFGHTGGVRLAAELGANSADHLLCLDDSERSLLRDNGVIATLLPGTSLVLGKGFADGRALVEAGVAVAVATDCNPGSCAFENLAMVLALACYGCRLSPAEAICGVTHNAAVSLDLAHEVGRLEPGLSADFLVLDTEDYRDLVYHAGSPLLSMVVNRGVPLGAA